MITNILVPTDFSHVADNALLFALNFAKKCNAGVHVLHVNSIPVADAYFPASVYPSVLEHIQEATKASFEKLRDKYKNTGHDFTASSIMGYMYDEISTYADAHKIDMIIMGTSGSSALKEILIGSNTAAVIAKSEIPVMVIPNEAKYHDLTKIVYATDNKEPEFPAVSRLIYLGKLYDSEITVLHVKSEYDLYLNPSENFFLQNRTHISYPKLRVLNADDPDIMEGINNFINKENSDLLVVAKHNYNFFGRLFHRSLGKRMAYHTRIPLLILYK